MCLPHIKIKTATVILHGQGYTFPKYTWLKNSHFITVVNEYDPNTYTLLIKLGHEEELG